jgi:hypothetical protein
MILSYTASTDEDSSAEVSLPASCDPTFVAIYNLAHTTTKAILKMMMIIFEVIMMIVFYLFD